MWLPTLSPRTQIAHRFAQARFMKRTQRPTRRARDASQRPAQRVSRAARFTTPARCASRAARFTQRPALSALSCSAVHSSAPLGAPLAQPGSQPRGAVHSKRSRSSSEPRSSVTQRVVPTRFVRSRPHATTTTTTTTTTATHTRSHGCCGAPTIAVSCTAVAAARHELSFMHLQSCLPRHPRSRSRPHCTRSHGYGGAHDRGRGLIVPAITAGAAPTIAVAASLPPVMARERRGPPSGGPLSSRAVRGAQSL